MNEQEFTAKKLDDLFTSALESKAIVRFRYQGEHPDIGTVYVVVDGDGYMFTMTDITQAGSKVPCQVNIQF